MPSFFSELARGSSFGLGISGSGGCRVEDLEG
jgi:hypothetical protein